MKITKLLIASFFTLIGICTNDTDCQLKLDSESSKIVDACRKYIIKEFK